MSSVSLSSASSITAPTARGDRLRWVWRLAAVVGRLTRYEFWPREVFYLPMVPWWVVLWLRHGCRATFTAANPGIPHSGFLGESKHDTLRHLPADLGVATERVEPAPLHERAARVEAIVASRGWPWPIIIKPDAGERGRSVKLARGPADVRRALSGIAGPVVVQPYHPGPFEAGVFYVREPGVERGRVFSITLKEFPAVEGDGKSTLRRLIWAHPRLRLQAARFMARLGDAAQQVPPRGQVVPLAIAGNHCQGTLFRDGEHLRGPALEDAIERAARAIPGFAFGRFDIRAPSAEDFTAARGLGIVEVNGVLAESTNIYDPGWPLWRAYLTLARQWSAAFRIGSAQARAGARVSSARELYRAWRMHVRTRAGDLSD